MLAFFQASQSVHFLFCNQVEKFSDFTGLIESGPPA
jgi:hypothetical protein